MISEIRASTLGFNPGRHQIPTFCQSLITSLASLQREACYPSCCNNGLRNLGPSRPFCCSPCRTDQWGALMWVQHIADTDLASGAWTCLCAWQNRKACSALESAFLTFRSVSPFLRYSFPILSHYLHLFFFFFIIFLFLEFDSFAMLVFKEQEIPKERAKIPFTLLLLLPNQSCLKGTASNSGFW